MAPSGVQAGYATAPSGFSADGIPSRVDNLPLSTNLRSSQASDARGTFGTAGNDAQGWGSCCEMTHENYQQ